MVTKRWHVGARTASIYVLASLLIAGLPGVPASHSYGTGYHAPAEGMQATIQLPWYGNVTVTFGTPTERIVGHHEWREVVPVLSSLEHANGTYESGELYDLMTGQPMGYYYADASPAFSVEPLPPLLEWASALSFEFGGLLSTLGNAVPESYLWGRHLWLGDSWTVPGAPLWGAQTETTVQVRGGHDHGTEVSVELQTLVPFDGGGGFATSWLLTGADGFATFGDERTFRYGTYTDPDDIQWQGTFDVPVTVIAQGGEPLPFEGHSDATIVAERDQNLEYGNLGFLPFDPEPHALFDVNEAAGIAWSLDVDELRAFKARASNPYLASADMNVGWAVPSQVSWTLRFEEGGRNAVAVHLAATKVPGLPLVVTDAWAENEGVNDDPLSAAARSATETAAIGDLARLADDVVPGLPNRIRAYSWEVNGWNEQASVGFRFDYGSALAYPFPDFHVVWSDAARGIVYGAIDYGYQSPLVDETVGAADEIVPLP